MRTEVGGTKRWMGRIGLLGLVVALLLVLGVPAAQATRPSSPVRVSMASVTQLPLYRLYATLDRHFYTTSATERNQLLSNPPGNWLGWTSEGTVGYLSKYQVSSSLPVYRLYRNYHHVYTTSSAEVASLKSQGWTNETIIGYISTSQPRSDGCAVTPLYRLWKWQGDANDHLYTISVQERNTVKSLSGWTDEGILGYVWTGAPC